DPRIGDDQLAQLAPRPDDDLVTVGSADLACVGHRDLVVDEIEQDPLALQAVEAEDTVGAADIHSLDERRGHDRESSLADAELGNFGRLDTLAAGHADEYGRAAIGQGEPVGKARRQYRRLRAGVDHEAEWAFALDGDRHRHAFVTLALHLQ